MTGRAFTSFPGVSTVMSMVTCGLSQCAPCAPIQRGNDFAPVRHARTRRFPGGQRRRLLLGNVKADYFGNNGDEIGLGQNALRRIVQVLSG